MRSTAQPVASRVYLVGPTPQHANEVWLGIYVKSELAAVQERPVYLHETHVALLKTLACMGARGARCVLSWEERKPEEEAHFIELARQQGFACRLLTERLDEITQESWDGRHDGVGTRRIVVWELRLQVASLS